jgi:hypothetical protein
VTGGPRARAVGIGLRLMEYMSPKGDQSATTARATEGRRARCRGWQTNKKGTYRIAPTPYTTEIVSALVQLNYLNDERASPPAVGAAIGAAIASLLAERIVEMRLQGSTNSKR